MATPVEIDAYRYEVLELSIWDVVVTLGLDRFDAEISHYVGLRRVHLLHDLAAKAETRLDKLLYRWALLLRSREGDRMVELPGAFRQDAAGVVSALLGFSLPRRAQILASKFNLPFDRLAQLNSLYRSREEEEQRAHQLVGRIRTRTPLISYRALICSRALRYSLTAKPRTFVFDVSRLGCITINRFLYGMTNRRY
jgi:hypothetical protein